MYYLQKQGVGNATASIEWRSLKDGVVCVVICRRLGLAFGKMTRFSGKRNDSWETDQTGHIIQPDLFDHDLKGKKIKSGCC